MSHAAKSSSLSATAPMSVHADHAASHAKKGNLCHRIAEWLDKHKKTILIIITILAITALTAGIGLAVSAALGVSLFAIKGAVSLGAAFLLSTTGKCIIAGIAIATVSAAVATYAGVHIARSKKEPEAV